MIYHAHYCALTRLAALLVIDVAAAEEAVQVAFAAMYGRWRHLRDSDEALAYLLRAVVIRTRSPRAADPNLPSRKPPPPQAGQPAITASEALLVTALHTLPARQREALVLRYYADLPDTEIAAAMGIRARAVTGHIRRGMATLQAAHRGPAPSGLASGNAAYAVARRFARQADRPGPAGRRTRGE